MTDGLKDAHREAIIAALAANDRVERAVLFGSRATGTNTVSSDVDIALFGNRLTLTDQARLAAALEEIPMAQSVDLVLYDSIRTGTLRDHIRRQGVEWPLRTRRESTAATFREVSAFTIGGGWGQDTEFDDCVPVRVIRGTDFARIRNGDFSRIPARYEQRSKVRRRILKPGDILLEISGGSRSSNQSTGRSCFITNRALAQLGKNVIPASFCRLVRVDPAVIDPRLAYYALQDMYVSGRAVLYEQQSTGISNFQFEYFLDSEVFRLPPLSEQLAIAHVLGTLDDKIELNRRMSATLEAMARALFKSLFVDFDPVRAKMEGRDTGLPQDIADLFPDRLVDSELGAVPEGWDVEPLSEHFEAVKGVSYKGGGLGRSGMPLHNLNSVHEGGGYKYEGIKFYSGEYTDRHVVHPGDVLVANTEQGHDRLLIGYAAIVPEIFGELGIVSHHVYRLRPRRQGRLSAPFLHSLLNSPWMHDLVSGYANGTTVNMLPVDAVQKPMVLVPPGKLREAFDALALRLEHRREQTVQESRTLGVLRDVLLPKLISGELRVNGLEPPSAHDDHPAPVGVHGA